MIKLKAATAASDLAIWRWLGTVVEKLGTDGMSSDESSTDDVETVYRVKKMAWRWEIEASLNIIDRERRLNSDIFPPQGSVPTKRIHGDNNLISTRAPVCKLPRTFYDDDWYNETPEEHRQLTLDVSEEIFQWYKFLV